MASSAKPSETDGAGAFVPIDESTIRHVLEEEMPATASPEAQRVQDWAEAAAAAKPIRPPWLGGDRPSESVVSCRKVNPRYKTNVDYMCLKIDKFLRFLHHFNNDIESGPLVKVQRIWVEQRVTEQMNPIQENLLRFLQDCLGHPRKTADAAQVQFRRLLDVVRPAYIVLLKKDYRARQEMGLLKHPLPAEEEQILYFRQVIPPEEEVPNLDLPETPYDWKDSQGLTTHPEDSDRGALRPDDDGSSQDETVERPPGRAGDYTHQSVWPDPSANNGDVQQAEESARQRFERQTAEANASSARRGRAYDEERLREQRREAIRREDEVHLREQRREAEAARRDYEERGRQERRREQRQEVAQQDREEWLRDPEAAQEASRRDRFGLGGRGSSNFHPVGDAPFGGTRRKEPASNQGLGQGPGTPDANLPENELLRQRLARQDRLEQLKLQEHEEKQRQRDRIAKEKYDLEDPVFYLSLPAPFNVVPHIKRTVTGNVDAIRLISANPVLKFSGDARDYRKFVTAFRAYVHECLIPVSDKICVLDAATSQASGSVMEGWFRRCHDRSKNGYKKALECMQVSYGSGTSYLESTYAEVNRCGKVTGRKLSALRALSTSISVYKLALEEVGVHPVHTLEGDVLEKLQQNEKERYLLKRQGSGPGNINDLLEFLWDTERLWNKQESLTEARVPGAQTANGAERKVAARRIEPQSDEEEETLSVNGACSLLEQCEEEGLEMSLSALKVLTDDDPCFLCKTERGHLIKNCPKFKKMEADERRRKLMESNRCFTCFRKGHGQRQCDRKIRCRICDGPHNVLLHTPQDGEGAPRPPGKSSPGSGSRGPVGARYHGRESSGERSDDESRVVRQQEETPSPTYHLSRSPEARKSVPEEGRRYLTTAQRVLPIWVARVDGEGGRILVNALLDTGASSTLLSKTIADQLSLPGHYEDRVINLAAGVTHPVKLMPSCCKIRGVKGRVSFEIGVTVLPEAVGQCFPVDWDVEKKQYAHLRDLPFEKVDPDMPVHMLIGSTEAYYTRSISGDICGLPNEPVAAQTPLGWVAHGKLTSGTPQFLSRSAQLVLHGVENGSFRKLSLNDAGLPLLQYHIQVEKTRREEGRAVPQEETKDHPEISARASKTMLDQLTKKVAEMQEPDLLAAEEDYAFSQEERRCVQLMADGRRFVDGKYEMPVLWKEGEPDLPFNRCLALKRLEHIIKKLKQDRKNWQGYSEIFDNYESQGYIRRIGPKDPPAKYFLAHFPVFRQDKTTTKVRVVFDGAAKYLKKCLNDGISAGPKLIQELPEVLMRFRKFPVALAGDLKEMFLQVVMKEEDRPYHRFLYQRGDDEEIIEYEWTRHPFGNAGSPAVAMATVRMHAEDCRESHPLAAEAALNCTLMDDTLTSFATEEEALDAYGQLLDMFALAGMSIRKFITNSKEVLAQIPPDQREAAADFLEIKGEAEDSPVGVKTLGIRYFPEADDFAFHLSMPESLTGGGIWTKRMYLVCFARLYDPLGLLAPFTIIPRMCFQELWRDQTDWDEALPPNEVWNEWVRSAEEDLPQLRVPRSLMRAVPGTNPRDYTRELHTFVDASEKALGAAVYLKSVAPSGEVTVTLVAGKSRLAPIKPVTIPRLELQAAAMGNALARTVSRTLGVDVRKYYSDSMTVLWWLRVPNKRLQCFVANRVHKILLHSDLAEWKYVRSEENPADLPSRGLMAKDLAASKLWFEGPAFLQSNEEPPQPEFKVTTAADRELRKTFKDLAFRHIDDGRRCILTTEDRGRKWPEVVREAAEVIIDADVTGGVTLSQNEKYEKAELRLLRNSQLETWPEVFSQLKTQGQVNQNHPLAKYNPQQDEEGVLRVTGRLRTHLYLGRDMSCPILLPQDSIAAELIMRDYHERELQHHGGSNHLLAATRSRFWITSGRNLAKRIKASCVRCNYRKARPQGAQEAPLPFTRVPSAEGIAAFERTGVDGAGPWMCSYGGKKQVKRWAAVFVCLSYGAIHVEILDDLSAAGFLQAFQRFTSRRGTPKRMFSDNGTNFKAADATIQRFLKTVPPEVLEMDYPHVEWLYSPQYTPHFGGIWERQVQSLKRALKMTLRSTYESIPSPTDIELASLFTTVEGYINERPLTYVSEDPDDLYPLTPSHFLRGQKFVDVVSPASDAKIGRRFNTLGRRFRKMNELLKTFWQRYVKEVVAEQNKLNRKWLGHKVNLAEGDVVVICEEENGFFPIGRVIKVFLNTQDNVGRVADIATKNNVIRRSLSRLYKLLTKEELESADVSEIPSIPEMPSMHGDQESLTGQVSDGAAGCLRVGDGKAQFHAFFAHVSEPFPLSEPSLSVLKVIRPPSIDDGVAMLLTDDHLSDFSSPAPGTKVLNCRPGCEMFRRDSTELDRMVACQPHKHRLAAKRLWTYNANKRTIPRFDIRATAAKKKEMPKFFCAHNIRTEELHHLTAPPPGEHWLTQWQKDNSVVVKSLNDVARFRKDLPHELRRNRLLAFDSESRAGPRGVSLYEGPLVYILFGTYNGVSWILDMEALANVRPNPYRTLRDVLGEELRDFIISEAIFAGSDVRADMLIANLEGSYIDTQIVVPLQSGTSPRTVDRGTKKGLGVAQLMEYGTLLKNLDGRFKDLLPSQAYGAHEPYWRFKGEIYTWREGIENLANHRARANRLYLSLDSWMVIMVLRREVERHVEDNPDDFKDMDEKSAVEKALEWIRDGVPPYEDEESSSADSMELLLHESDVEHLQGDHNLSKSPTGSPGQGTGGASHDAEARDASDLINYPNNWPPELRGRTVGFSKAQKREFAEKHGLTLQKSARAKDYKKQNRKKKNAIRKAAGLRVQFRSGGVKNRIELERKVIERDKKQRSKDKRQLRELDLRTELTRRRVLSAESRQLNALQEHDKDDLREMKRRFERQSQKAKALEEADAAHLAKKRQKYKALADAVEADLISRRRKRHELERRQDINLRREEARREERLRHQEGALVRRRDLQRQADADWRRQLAQGETEWQQSLRDREESNAKAREDYLAKRRRH